MTVVFLNPVGTLGGAERSLIDVAAVLRALRPNLRLRIVAGADGPLADEAARFGIGFEVVPMPAAMSAFGESGLREAAGGRVSRVAGLAVRTLSAALAVPGYLRRLRRVLA